MKTLISIFALICSVSFAGMVNLSTQSQTIPQKLGSVDNPNHATLIANGWREMPELPAVSNGFERSSVTWVEGDGTNAIPQYTDTLIADRLAAEAAADLKANGTRYHLQNEYLTLCDQLTGGTNHVKLGFADLEAIVKGLMASDPNTAVALSLQLLTLNAALVREGGLQWWDGCLWTPGL